MSTIPQPTHRRVKRTRYSSPGLAEGLSNCCTLVFLSPEVVRSDSQTSLIQTCLFRHFIGVRDADGQ